MSGEAVSPAVVSSGMTAKPDPIVSSKAEMPSSSKASAPTIDETEERLRQTLVGRLRSLCRSGKSLDRTYRHFLLRSAAARTARAYHLTDTDEALKVNRDKLYKKVGGEMRLSVEKFVLRPNAGTNKRGRDRKDLDDSQMRAAFTLRECKEHEQKHFVKTLVSSGGFAGLAAAGPFEKGQILLRQKNLEATAAMLQHNEENELLRRARLKVQRAKVAERARLLAQQRRTSPAIGTRQAVKQEEENRKTADALQKDRAIEERERQQARERERQRELARKQEDEERKTRLARERDEAERKARLAETPRQALRRLYEPIFQALWDMEFSNLHGTNPFRIIIDAENCAMMGVPDYCQIVEKPMNLTYIQQKVNEYKYETLQEFFADVELMIKNSLLYNSDLDNPYHIAAKEMRKQFKKLAKSLITSLQQQT